MATSTHSLHPEPVGFPLPIGGTLALDLTVSDPEVIAELERCASGAERDGYALSGLRLGVLALRQARGELDAVVVRDAGQKIVTDLESVFRERGGKITDDPNRRATSVLRPGIRRVPSKTRDLF